MASYEGLRKLTFADKPVVIKFKCAGTNLRVPISQVPTYNELCFMVQRLFRSEVSNDLDNLVLRYEDEDGDLITLLDDADISHAISLSSLLRLTVNDKMTHPVMVPIENLATKLLGLNHAQTVSALTAALVDLQERIGKVVGVVQSQHPTSGTDEPSSGIASKQPKDSVGVLKVNGTDALVLSAESIDQLLEPRKMAIARQESVSSQTSHRTAASPSLSTPQPSLANVAGQFQQQVQQQQQHSTPSQPWTPQSAAASNPPAQSPIPTGGGPAVQYNQPYLPQPPQPQPQQQLHQIPQPQSQQPVQQQPFGQYISGSTPQQQQQQGQQQRPAMPQSQPSSQVQSQGQLQMQYQQQQQQQQQHQSQAQGPMQHQLSQQQLPQAPLQQAQPQGRVHHQQPQQQQQQQPQQPQQQQPSTPYFQGSYAPSPFMPHQQQQQQQQQPYSAAGSGYTTVSGGSSGPGPATFARSNSLYMAQPEPRQALQQQPQPQQPPLQQSTVAPHHQAY